jgi:PAS domain S-box-containing protein
MLPLAPPALPTHGPLVADHLPLPYWEVVPELITATALLAVPLCLWRWGRGEPDAVRRVYRLLALCGLVFGAVLALGWVALAEAGAMGAPVRIALPAVVWVGALVLLWRLRPALTAIGRETPGTGTDGQIELLKAAVTASRDGVMIAEIDPIGAAGPRIVYANPAFERMTGYSAEEAVGLSPSILCQTSSFGPGSRSDMTEEEEAAVRAVRAALRRDEPSRLELPGWRKNGSRVWVEWQLVPVLDGGRCTHWVGVLRDTTERRAFEEQLRESQKMEAVGRLAGGIAHDFNNLLTVIRGNSEIVRESLANAPALAELADEVRGAAERAAGLVRQLLTFGRRQAAKPVVLDLNTVMTEMAGILRRLLGARVAIETELAAVPVRVRIDRSQLEQVVMNLAVNARDAMPEGGTLTIGTAAVTAPAPPGTDRGSVQYARLAVSDTGCGMTEEVKQHVFEPFFTTKGPDRGTGLGLATAYSIVTQAGGRIGIDSALGAGTTFRIDLPWCDDPTPTSSVVPVVARGNASEGRGRAILLVEDEDAVRKLARVTLEACGYKVTEAPDGETALTWVAGGGRLDLLVTDLTMPGIGGRDLAEQIRAARPEIGVLFISGYAPDIDSLYSLSGALFLAKPFTPADLRKAVAKALTRRPQPVANGV